MRTRYSDPRPGSNKAAVLALLSRDQGVTVSEIIAARHAGSKGSVGMMINDLDHVCGYNILRLDVGLTPEGGGRGRRPLVYKTVSRREWRNSGYLYTTDTSGAEHLVREARRGE